MKQKILPTIIKTKFQFGAYLHAFNKSKVSKKFVIFGQGRTGSTLLVDLLNSHPNIHCDGEIFSKKRHLFNGKIWFPYRFLRGMEMRNTNKVFGFKIKIYQLTRHQQIDPGRFLSTLESKDYQIIYIRRNNFLEHALSSLNANKTKQFHVMKGTSHLKKSVKLTAEELERGMQKRKAFQQNELNHLKGRTYFEVQYERDLKSSDQHQNICNKLFDFLELESVPVQTNLQKVLKKSAKEQLTNYEDLKDYFESTFFSVFFQED
jgi:Stf0 sulphotransferase.